MNTADVCLVPHAQMKQLIDDMEELLIAVEIRSEQDDPVMATARSDALRVHILSLRAQYNCPTALGEAFILVPPHIVKLINCGRNA